MSNELKWVSVEDQTWLKFAKNVFFWWKNIQINEIKDSRQQFSIELQ